VANQILGDERRNAQTETGEDSKGQRAGQIVVMDKSFELTTDLDDAHPRKRNFNTTQSVFHT